VGSEPLGKFSTLLYFSMGCQKRRLHRYDPIRGVLNMELLQFCYSQLASIPDGVAKVDECNGDVSTAKQILQDAL